MIHCEISKSNNFSYNTHMNKSIEQAIQTVISGGIIIFPTDTAFGIGCRIDDEKAAARLFEIRRRPETKATPVLVSGIEMAEQWVDTIPVPAKELMLKYWPGGLTVVLDSSDTRVAKLVKGGGSTIGVRMPDHQDLLEVIDRVGVPIVGSSANFAGKKTPFSLDEIDSELIKLVDFVLPGKTKGGTQPSTVIDGTSLPFTVLRQGSVVVENLNELYIDTRDNKKIIVKLIRDNCEFVRESTTDRSKADVVLSLIQEVCQDGGLSIQQIEKIYCEKGPGSFTGLRVGFAIANALSLALLVPINDNEIGVIDTPIYE